MLSTMQDEQLSLATLLRYAATVSRRRHDVDLDRGRRRTTTYREMGQDAARLANALRALGIGVGDRVGTFMWNNLEHMTVYAARPGDGCGAARAQYPAVPRATGLRGQPRRGPGRDRRRLAGADVRQLPAEPEDSAPRHRRQRRRRHAVRPRRRAGAFLHRTACRATGYVRLPGPGRAFRRRHVLYLGHHRRPQGRRLLAPLQLAARHAGDLADEHGLHRQGSGAGHRAAVPRQRVGPAVRGDDVRREPADARPVPAAGPAAADDGRREADLRRRGADHLGRRAGRGSRRIRRTSPTCARARSAARRCRRR